MTSLSAWACYITSKTIQLISPFSYYTSCARIAYFYVPEVSFRGCLNRKKIAKELVHQQRLFLKNDTNIRKEDLYNNNNNKKKTQNHRLPSILYKISYLIELKMDKYIFHNILKKQTLKINTISLVLYEIFLPTLLKR